MTTEVAILNKQAVAIAADSASTGYDEADRPIYSQADKIFELSKHHPVGIMIYGSAAFMGIPWETVIKMFRDRLGTESYNSLADYGKRFIQFVQEETSLFPEKIQDNYALESMYDYFDILRYIIHDNIEYRFQDKAQLGMGDIQELTDEVIDQQMGYWQKGKTNVKDVELFEKKFINRYKKEIVQCIDDVFEDIPLTDGGRMNLHKLASYIFVFYPEGGDFITNTGIVITGFGKLDIFPSLVSYRIQGTVLNHLKFLEEPSRQVDYRNSAMIIPFAQDDVIRTFIDGISNRMEHIYVSFIDELFGALPRLVIDEIGQSLDEEQKAKVESRIRGIGRENLKNGFRQINQIKADLNVYPILDVVSILAKNELSEMAESLVSLTCMRKKFSTEDETVGGPVDVAVISKGDGFIWINRKKYFDSNDNQRFLAKYFK